MSIAQSELSLGVIIKYLIFKVFMSKFKTKTVVCRQLKTAFWFWNKLRITWFLVSVKTGLQCIMWCECDNVRVRSGVTQAASPTRRDDIQRPPTRSGSRPNSASNCTIHWFFQLQMFSVFVILGNSFTGVIQASFCLEYSLIIPQEYTEQVLGLGLKANIFCPLHPRLWP